MSSSYVAGLLDRLDGRSKAAGVRREVVELTTASPLALEASGRLCTGSDGVKPGGEPYAAPGRDGAAVRGMAAVVSDRALDDGGFVAWHHPDTPAAFVTALREHTLHRLSEDESYGPAPKRLPLHVWRKPDGMPNYRNPQEQSAYLKEAGWLEWSTGARKNPPGADAWEQWLTARADPDRVAPGATWAEMGGNMLDALKVDGRTARRKYTDDEMLALFAKVEKEGGTVRDAAKQVWEQWGYLSVKSCEQTLRFRAAKLGVKHPNQRPRVREAAPVEPILKLAAHNAPQGSTFQLEANAA